MAILYQDIMKTEEVSRSKYYLECQYSHSSRGESDVDE
jgi:hypothetical protein